MIDGDFQWAKTDEPGLTCWHTCKTNCFLLIPVHVPVFQSANRTNIL